MDRLLVSLGSSIVACATIAASPQTQPTDRDRAELKGPVQSVASRWQANHKDDYGSVEERNLGRFTYDEAGTLLAEQEITPDFIRNKVPERHGPGETLFRSIMGSYVERYRFDRGGNMIERQTWYGEHAGDAPAITERFTYDAAGRMAVRETLTGDGKGKAISVRLFTRDSAGNVTIEEVRDAGRQAPWPRMHYSYEFDSHGNWTAKIVRRENVPEDAYEFRYAGNLFRTITYFGNARGGPALR